MGRSSGYPSSLFIGFQMLKQKKTQKKPKEPIDDRPWVLEHEQPLETPNRELIIRFWHYYPNHFKSAMCGKPPIPGMPICGKEPGVTVTCPSQVCSKCAQWM